MLIKCLGAAGMNLKGLLRTRSLVALCVAAAVYLLDGYFYYVSWDEGSRYGTGAYSYGLMGASRGMEVFLLLLMMAGLLMVRRTREDGVEEISAAWPQGRMVMAWGQIVASAAAAGV